MSNVGGNTFLSVLRQLAEIDPDRPSLTCGEVTLTRAGLVERVERLAALFAARGVAEGSTVTIAVPNSAGFVESMFAAWAVGAVPQPVSHRLPPPVWKLTPPWARPGRRGARVLAAGAGRPLAAPLVSQPPAGN